ncbi:MAG: hypothetical protein K2X04_03390 [Burkholderiales bacterium]|nr:hypothetical protein [Burkholderiales bacterium]
MLIEIIATNLEEAICAEQYGANRLELIHDFELGGLSPKLELARDVCTAVNIPVNVMVRPHGESFIYTPQDMTTILHEIDYLLSNSKVSSIVFGSLTENRVINLRQLESVIKLLENTGVGLTFHRAIDVSSDVVAAYQELQNYTPHLTRVLSSGGKDNAIGGSKQLAEMQQGSRGVILLAGAGITPENATDLISISKVSEIHLGTGVRTNGRLDQGKFEALKNNLASVKLS